MQSIRKMNHKNDHRFLPHVPYVCLLAHTMYSLRTFVSYILVSNVQVVRIRFQCCITTQHHWRGQWDMMGPRHSLLVWLFFVFQQSLNTLSQTKTYCALAIVTGDLSQSFLLCDYNDQFLPNLKMLPKLLLSYELIMYSSINMEEVLGSCQKGITYWALANHTSLNVRKTPLALFAINY